MFNNNFKLGFKIIGLDLAGKPENPTGICFLDSDKIECCTIFEDNEILNIISNANPSLIVIDAPLSLPRGRCCLNNECPCSDIGGHFRKAEDEMRKYGRTLPLTFRGMRILTERGIKIADKLKSQYEVIESHPRTIQKILGPQNATKIKKTFHLSKDISEHEMDAVLLVIAGINYYNNNFMEFGDKEEGIIILPMHP
ncbi:MAG: DUF429 domain-containing protein [Methanobacterium sp.]|jgi:predicted nuclease with RNAse H fold